jgi:hypothetical protein
MFAASLGGALTADALKVAEHLRFGMGNLLQPERIETPLQQTGRIRPSAGEGLQLGCRDAHVSRDMSHFVMTAAGKLLSRGVAGSPIAPPLLETTEWSY